MIDVLRQLIRTNATAIGALVTLVTLSSSAFAQVDSAPLNVDQNNTRVEFFKIIEGNPELVTIEEKKMNIQNPDRKPASTDEELYNFLLGRQDVDPEKEVIYYIEVRKNNTAKPIPVRSRDEVNATALYRLQPGEMLRMSEKTEAYLDMLRLENKDEAAWRKITSADKDKPKDMFFQYDWRKIYSIHAHHQPVELALKFPKGRSNVTVYSEPGRFNYKDCEYMKSLCIGWPDRYAKVFLFDTALIDLKKHVPGQTKFELFYQVGFAYKTNDGKYKYGVGWIPSEQADRQINYLPGSAFGGRGLASSDLFMTEEQRRKQFQNMFLFAKNADVLESQDTRWTQNVNNRGKSIFDVDIAWEGNVRTTYNKLDQTFLPEMLEQFGATAGFGATAPIFVDLEVQGSVSITAPLSSQGEFEGEALEPVYVFKYDQWLNYTTPVKVANTPVRFSVGAYYMSLLDAPTEYGFRSLVGAQLQSRLDFDTSYLFLRFGAVGADLELKFRNREFGGGFGWYMDPADKYKSWVIFTEFSDLDYRSEKTGTVTRFDTFHLGLMKSF